ncbi:MAG: BlaI/MecI/CopY family transcriptional regulator [Gemmatimonadota bacterium]|nr:BlaI/MecI/CopY family transcriptional regulator [Gemmatimonadota bacterium]
MTRTSSVPTEAELAILRVLWAGGPQTVRDIHQVLGASTSYTTTLKLLQNMTAKSLVERDTRERQHTYTAGVEQDATLVAVAARVVRRLFNGSRTDLMLRALGDGTVTRNEISELRRLLRLKEKELE